MAIEPPPDRSILDRPWFAPMLLSLAWLATVMIVQPVGEFPTNDDFAYSLTMRALVRDGRFQLTDWQSVTLTSQALWAAPFCLIGGFSHLALRISTLVAGLLGIHATHALLVHFRLGRRFSLFSSLVVALNPMYLALADTFMTDVPAYATIVGATYFIFTGLDDDRPGRYWFGLFLGLVSVFVRQTGLGVFFGLLAAYPLFRPSWRLWLTHALLPTIAAWGLLAVYDLLLAFYDQVPYVYYARHKMLAVPINDLLHWKLGVVKVPLYRIPPTSVYLGIFFAPVFVLLVSAWGRATTSARRIALGVAGATAAGLVALALESAGVRMPFFGNIIVDFGIGPQTLKGEAPKAPRWLWAASSAVGVWGAVAMYALWARTALDAWIHRRDRDRPIRLPHFVFLLVLVAVLIGPLLVMYGGYYDRYILSLYLVAILFAAASFAAASDPWRDAGRVARGLAIAGLVLLGAWSIGVVHDYFAWNRARWTAARYATETLKVDPDRLDGGFEVNNFVHFEKNLYVKGDVELVKLDPATEILLGATHVLALGPVVGFRTLSEFPCRAWLPYSPQRILLLEAEPGEPAALAPQITPAPLGR